MQGSHGQHWQCRQRPLPRLASIGVPPAAAVVLALFSTRLPPPLLARLREAAPRLGLRQDEIVAALDRYLREHGC